MDITRKVLLLSREPADPSGNRATFAIPGGDAHESPSSADKYCSVFDLVGVNLPPKPFCDRLVDVYFFTIHWFSLVVHEPSFRKRYSAISETGLARPSDKPFLCLLLMVLVMACHYGHSFVDASVRQNLDLNATRHEYLRVVRRDFMDLLDEDTLEFVQICTLLGSYWLYWGKPRSSFGILGAATRAAQAISLHRQAASRFAQSQTQAAEERKRVWWTIYTWDRFATIVYGRPLGISDRDCDVQMPASFREHLVDMETLEAADVELSSYQTQLNKIYQLSSPLLANVYGIRGSGDTTPAEMAETTTQIDKSMHRWRQNLPSTLKLDEYADVGRDTTLEMKMHQLQALSLELTYQNLMIIIHRPLLADWSYRRGRESRMHSIVPPDSDLHRPDGVGRVEPEVYETSFQRCLKAAGHIAAIENSKPNLIRLAGKTHLVSFLGMNIFTSSVVLFICAMSEPLSDAAQEAKRGISWNLRVLKLLPDASLLSDQCRAIIEDLVSIIMEKEREAMMAGSRALDSGVPSASRSRNDHDVTQTASASRDDLWSSSFHGPRFDEDGPISDWANASMGRTLQRLNQVLKDVSSSRVQQRSDAPTPHQLSNLYPQAHQAWASDWSRTMPADAGNFPVNDLQAQDVGQFWLWETTPMQDEMNAWDPISYG